MPTEHTSPSGCFNRTGLRNAAATPAVTYRSNRPEAPGKQIDHVLFRHPSGGSVSVTTKLHFEEEVALADGRTMFASDHFGVEARIDFASPSRRSQPI